jgi:glycosyltransferase involved in cell wall biosynthesis
MTRSGERTVGGTRLLLPEHPRPTISVVICTYTGGRWDELRAAVTSVARQEHRALETIVVVDHDDSLLARARAELPDVVVTENRAQRGLSGARNTGVALARGDVVAFLDDDATAAPDWLHLLLSEYADEDVLGVGGSIVPVWEQRPAWFPAEFEWVVGCTYRGMPASRAHVRNLVGANMSFRRELLTELDGFLSGIGRVGTRPMGCEETELCIRARRARPGGVFVYQPLARVDHRVPLRRARLRYFLSRCYAEGLSKAHVVSASGVGAGLAAERSYTVRTLPRGFASALLAAATLRDRTGFFRAAAIAVGLLTTAGGFCAGRLARRVDVVFVRQAERAA